MRKNKKNANGGFTLIELIVTVAIMGVLAVVAVSSYTDVMREKRHEADNAVLNDINTQLNLLFADEAVWEEVLDELEPNRNNKQDTLFLTFVCSPAGKKGVIRLANTAVGQIASGPKLNTEMPLLYQGLVDTYGDSIAMESSDHQQGTYVVSCKFNSEQLSSVREFTITNDNTRITGVQDWRKAGG